MTFRLEHLFAIALVVVVVVLVLLPTTTTAFVPQPLLSKALVSLDIDASSLPSNPTTTHYWTASSFPFPPMTHNAAISPMYSFLVVAQDGGGGGGGGMMDILRNVAIGITAIVFLLAGLTYMTASVIIPAAAKELETECKELAPELWEQYQAKLEPGQTMGQRPDLMQELGAKLQPLLDAKIERQFAKSKEKGIDVSQDERAWKALDALSKSSSSSSSQPAEQGPTLNLSTTAGQWDDDDDDDDNGAVVDAQIVEEKQKE